MLKYFYDNQLINITEKHPKNWEEAIEISGEVLKEKGLITDEYIQSVIRDVHEYGPYIVIIPNVAMPHSSANNQGVLGTGIGFTILPEKIYFEEGNEEKQAKLFFTLAAKNGEEHMQNIANLSEMLMTDGLVDDLLTIQTMDDYLAIMKKYNI